MTMQALASDLTPDHPDHTLNRVVDLLLRLERGDPRRQAFRPIAHVAVDLAPGIIAATVFVDAGDGAGDQPFALHEIGLAAQCLALDPPFPAAPSLAPRLADAALQAATAANLLNRSLS